MTVQQGLGKTSRTDLWWVQPTAVFLGLSGFIVYATWAVFQGVNYYHGAYLSPFYSPELFGNSPHSVFGPKPGWWPAIIPFSPALLVAWAPAGLRFTCYYYRGAYYKSFWASPPSCAVAGLKKKKYRGENLFPLIMQNSHRYFLYLAIIFVLILAYDAFAAFWFVDAATGEKSFGMGVGSLVLLINVILLGGYTFGCHSFRHLVGGIRDKLSSSPIQKKAYDCASCLNRQHMGWAWVSLFWVAFTDVYIRFCAMGIITDVRFF
jgi:hypothetical protein